MLNIYTPSVQNSIWTVTVGIFILYLSSRYNFFKPKSSNILRGYFIQPPYEIIHYKLSIIHYIRC
jgi:hypothetical protein